MGVAWPDLLGPRLHGRLVIAALGDPSAGDDGAGPLLIELLRSRPGLVLLDCGTYPQNFLGPIAKASPHVVMLVDAAELGMRPGEIRVLDRDAVGEWGGGSHGFPLDVLMEQIEVMSGAEVFLLGIQVGSLVRDAPLHPAVEATVRDLASFLSHYAARPHGE